MTQRPERGGGECQKRGGEGADGEATADPRKCSTPVETGGDEKVRRKIWAGERKGRERAHAAGRWHAQGGATLQPLTIQKLKVERQEESSPTRQRNRTKNDPLIPINNRTPLPALIK
jgi:hypothetical protein